MKKTFIMALLLAMAPLSVLAQQKTMGDIFREMPDSLMPYLTKNNRLDMLDFIEAHMKAEVTNRLDGKTEMTFLSGDSLSIAMNSVLQVDMSLQTVAEPVDSSTQVVRVWRTYRINESQAERVLDVYTSAWRLLSSCVVSSSLLRRDEKVKAAD